MNLTDKQKKWILKNKNSKSVKRLAIDLNIERKEVEEYLNSLNVSKQTRIFFYLILLLIPIVFFVLLEISLNIINYGTDTTTWVNISSKYMGLNPDLAKRYFYTVKKVPKSIQDVFEIEKQNNSFRVFVLGGSSAAGYPYMPLGSFSRYIRRRLELTYPKLNIEVVNISLTAVNSFTIRDLIPDVLKQSPDLILIYAGHNEYYGALGIGSMESLGNSRSLVNFLIGINNFKIIQLVRNFIRWSLKQISNDKNTEGTLMSRMAEKQSIPYNSELYNLGIEQFEGNITDVLEMTTKAKVPVILSTLVSNLKDQPPFISNETKNFPKANSVFIDAKRELQLGNNLTADSLFRLAKELDHLRFRAPERINKILLKLSLKYKTPIVQADILLNFYSPQHIIGNNLLVDHLHFNLKGYQLLGKEFYNVMNENNYLPNAKKEIPYEKQDSITISNFIFSKLDSTIANFKIKLLKNDWPFVRQINRKEVRIIIHRDNYIDTLAYKFINGDEEWEKVQRLLAVSYLSNGEFEKAKKNIDLLIHQYPIVVEYHNFIANKLISKKRFDEAFSYLFKGYTLKPDHFFSKWLGIINLSKGNLEQSIKFLEESLIYNKDDAQVYYNLSGAYAKNKSFSKALKYINNCISIDSKYRGSKILKEQLQTIIEK